MPHHERIHARRFRGISPHAAARVEHANHKALEKVGAIVEAEAKDVIGTHRYGWPPLAESTLAKKDADTPLLESGAMRDSIGHTVGHNEVTIGTDSQVAVYQELGTSRIPPRPFLQGALEHKREEVVKTIGHEVVGALISKARQRRRDRVVTDLQRALDRVPAIVDG